MSAHSPSGRRKFDALLVLLWGALAGGWFLVGYLTGLPRAESQAPRALAAPGFEQIEFRVQESGTLDWARFRIEDGQAVFLGWDQ